MDMDELFVKTTVERHDEVEEDLFPDGSAKRHRNQVQRLKSSQLAGSSPRLQSSAAQQSPRLVQEQADAQEHPSPPEHSRIADVRKKLPGQRGRGRPPKIPRVEGASPPAVMQGFNDFLSMVHDLCWKPSQSRNLYEHK